MNERAFARAVGIKKAIVRRRLFVAVIAAVFLVGCEATPEENEPTPVAKAMSVSVGNVEVNVDQLAAEAFARAGVEVAEALTVPLDRIEELIPVPKIKVSLRGDPSNVIEEVGVLGRSLRSGDIFVTIDQTRDDLEEVIGVWLPYTLAHEMMHSTRRIKGVGTRETLLDHFVEEGLADAFGLEVFPETPPIPWTSALSAAEAQQLWERAQPELDSPRQDTYFKWFFEDEEVPYWAGYAIGFSVVQSYGEREGVTPSESLQAEASEIVAGSAFAPGTDE